MENKCSGLNKRKKKAVIFPQEVSLLVKLLKPKISKMMSVYLERSMANDSVNIDFIYIVGS